MRVFVVAAIVAAGLIQSSAAQAGHRWFRGARTSGFYSSRVYSTNAVVYANVGRPAPAFVAASPFYGYSAFTATPSAFTFYSASGNCAGGGGNGGASPFGGYAAAAPMGYFVYSPYAYYGGCTGNGRASAFAGNGCRGGSSDPGLANRISSLESRISQIEKSIDTLNANVREIAKQGKFKLKDEPKGGKGVLPKKPAGPFALPKPEQIRAPRKLPTRKPDALDSTIQSWGRKPTAKMVDLDKTIHRWQQAQSRPNADALDKIIERWHVKRNSQTVNSVELDEITRRWQDKTPALGQHNEPSRQQITVRHKGRY